MRNTAVSLGIVLTFILSTLASEMPFMFPSRLRVVIRIPLMVQIPTAFSFLMSATFWDKTLSSLLARILPDCIGRHGSSQFHGFEGCLCPGRMTSNERRDTGQFDVCSDVNMLFLPRRPHPWYHRERRPDPLTRSSTFHSATRYLR